MKHGYAALLTVFVFYSAFACASGEDARAANLMGLAGGTGRGICMLPRCGNGDLAVAIASNSQFLVYAQDSRAAMADAAKTAADARGYTGTRIIVGGNASTNIPFADNYLDLLILCDATDATLAQESLREIARALSPNGKAIIGSDGAGLSQAVLSNWAAQSAMYNVQCTITNSALGLWAIFTKGLLPGADDWSHWYHGADNNPVSSDTALKWPYLSQSYGKPYHGAQPLNALAAGGRYFVLNGTHYRVFDRWTQPGDTFQLTAYNGYNSQVLWRYQLLPNTHVLGPVCVATKHWVYLLQSNCVVVLDAALGTVRERIAFDGIGPGVQGKWLALVSNTLFMLAGPIDASITRSGYFNIDEYAATAVELPWVYGSYLGAYDLAARTTLWVHVENCDIDIRNVGVAGDRLFFNATGPAAKQGANSGGGWVPPDAPQVARAGCLDTATGAILWTNEAPLDVEIINRFGSNYGVNPLHRANRGLLCTPNAVFMSKKGRTNFVALAVTDGRLLWSRGLIGAGVYSHYFYVSNMLHATSLKQWISLRLNPTNGAELGTWGSAGTCARVTVSPDAWYAGAGRGSSASGASVNSMGLKPLCEVGNVPANGMLYSTPHSCMCNTTGRGFINVGSAPSGFVWNAQANGAERLEYNDSGSVAPFPADQLDWPTYRANTARSACSLAPVTSVSSTIWRFIPAVRYAPTPPAAVNGFVFIGGADGKVRCINTGTGALQWEFITGGKIIATPTVADGRVYVGSGDGRAYCLEAATGRLLWKFRACPQERRIWVYDALMSTWPVNSGVLVENGVAYFGAGVMDWDGTHVFAVNATTGALLWHNSTSGFCDAYSSLATRKGMSVRGNLTLGWSNLWMATGNIGSAGGYSTATGAFNPPRVNPGQGIRGEDIGIMPTNLLVTGGMPLLRDANERIGMRQMVLSYVEVSPTGQRRYPEVVPFLSPERASFILPAWDNETTAMPRDDNNTLECWSTPTLMTCILTTRLVNATWAPQSWAEQRVQMGMNMLTSTAIANMPNPKVWGPVANDMWACVLAGNAIVIAAGNAASYNLISTTWNLKSYDRATGALRWNIPLPAEPVLNGVSIDRNGNAIVAMVDGSVLAVGVVPEPLCALALAAAFLATRYRPRR